MEFEIVGSCLVCRPRDMLGGIGGVKITDSEAKRCFEKLRVSVPSLRTRLALSLGAPMRLAEVILPCQSLGDRAVRALVEALVRGNMQIDRLELYKNQLGDAAAQALATLLERAPAPGVHRMHLSHNYFTQVGVGLILTSAVRCKRYPMKGVHQGPQRAALGKEDVPQHGAPLWLRVEHQLCPWPVLTNSSKAEQLSKAQKLLDHLGNKLLDSCQEQGILPQDLGESDDGFRMFCIPSPPANAVLAPPEPELWNTATIGSYGFNASSPCHAGRCRFATAHGPIVHLPYFWSQGGREIIPESALLSQHDPGWKTWAPRQPIGMAQGRPQLQGRGVANEQLSLPAPPPESALSEAQGRDRGRAPGGAKGEVQSEARSHQRKQSADNQQTVDAVAPAPLMQRSTDSQQTIEAAPPGQRTRSTMLNTAPRASAGSKPVSEAALAPKQTQRAPAQRVAQLQGVQTAVPSKATGASAGRQTVAATAAARPMQSTRSTAASSSAGRQHASEVAPSPALGPQEANRLSSTKPLSAGSASSWQAPARAQKPVTQAKQSRATKRGISGEEAAHMEGGDKEIPSQEEAQVFAKRLRSDTSVGIAIDLDLD